MKYRKKPAVIDAFCFGHDSTPEWAKNIEVGPTGIAHIRTLEGVMMANYGDWIIKGIKDELYPCKPDIFAATYEPA